MKKWILDRLPQLFCVLLVIFSVLMISNHAKAKTTAEWRQAGIEAIQEGGKIILLRHAYAPRTEANGNHDKNYKHMVCSTQRDILSEGIKQSKAIGQWVIDNNIVIDKVIASPTCRTYKTAKYAGWEYTLNENVRNVGDSKKTKKRVNELRKIIANWNGKGNLVIVTHFKMINPLFPAVKAGNGEMIITDGTTLGDKDQYFKPIGRIKFEYDVTNKL